jgi:mannose-6-phosphate isomerase-like protein (cupin superfamily)
MNEAGRNEENYDNSKSHCSGREHAEFDSSRNCPKIMPMAHSPVLRSGKECRAVAVVGDVYQFLATGDDTNGKYATFESIVGPGGGPPPHLHRREEEAFYVLEGEVAFYTDGKRSVLGPGMFANMPVGVPHSFRNETEKPVRMLVTVAPAGLENMFFEFGVEMPAGSTTAAPPTEAEIQKLLAVAPNYGIEVLLSR